MSAPKINLPNHDKVIHIRGVSPATDGEFSWFCDARHSQAGILRILLDYYITNNLTDPRAAYLRDRRKRKAVVTEGAR
jgi:hypothetical protein